VKTTATIASVPNQPGVYALMGGSSANRYFAYVGIAGNLRQRIVQHLILRDSSIATGTSAACLNPDYVTEVRWWLHKKFKRVVNRAAAELVALKFLDPALRSRGLSSLDAQRLFSDPAFKQEMEALFEGPPSGTLQLPTMQSIVERLDTVERSLERLSATLQKSKG